MQVCLLPMTDMPTFHLNYKKQIQLLEVISIQLLRYLNLREWMFGNMNLEPVKPKSGVLQELKMTLNLLETLV